MLFRVGLGVPQEGDLLLAGSTPTLPRKKNGARVWGTKAKPLVVLPHLAGGFAVSEPQKESKTGQETGSG